jgi:hypothetical protein
MKDALGGVLRGGGSVAVHVRCPRTCHRRYGQTVVGVPLTGALRAAILRFGLRVTLSPGARPARACSLKAGRSSGQFRLETRCRALSQQQA